MAEMTTHQRMTRMYGHREADRVPVTDNPWGAALERWRREGLPAGADCAEYFGLDRFAGISADNSPRYPEKTIEETEECTVTTTRWGVTMRNWKHMGGVPEFLDYTVTDPDSWREARARMKPDRDRIDWDLLKKSYPEWRRQGRWVRASLWFGFDVTHSFFVGTERLLVALLEQPEWAREMFDHFLDVHLALFDMVWEAGYRFDEVCWPDDMGYKNAQFFSVGTYRDLLKPVHARAVEWAHRKGARVWLHSCGDVRPFVPEFIDIGVDMLNPLEVKAGMDPLELKRQYGDRLALRGGLSAALYERPEKLWEEMRRVIPVMKQNGGYVVSSDHSVPQSFGLEDFRRFVELAKELGSYER